MAELTGRGTLVKIRFDIHAANGEPTETDAGFREKRQLAVGFPSVFYTLV